MRQIISEEEKNKKIKRNQLVLGVILIFLMVFSTIAFAFSNKSSISNTETIKYKGIKFTRDSSGYWNFNINGDSETQFLTTFNPEETQDIQFQTNLNFQNYANKPLYFAGEPGEHISEINRNLGRFALRVNYACLEGEKCENDYPVKECSNNIIVFKEPINNENTDNKENNNENEEEKIYQQDNCIFIIASYSNMVRYSDKFLFGLLGI